MTAPVAGEVIVLGRAATPQLTQAFMFRVVGTREGGQEEGWLYVDGFPLNRLGYPEKQREIYVWVAGIRRLP